MRIALLTVLFLALAPALSHADKKADPAKDKGKKAQASPSKDATLVDLKTSMGTIRIKLFRKKAPISTANFLKYVRSGFYKGTVFHRVIPNFMVQGGGLTPGLKRKKTGKPIKNEADNGLTNDRGTVAMARTSSPHSATAQFFINVKANPFLNHRSKTRRGWGYTVFGKVVKGMKVVDKIRTTKTATQGYRRNVPVKPIVILETKVVK